MRNPAGAYSETMSRPIILHVDDDPNDVILLQHACKKAELEIRLQNVADGGEARAYLEGRGALAEALLPNAKSGLTETIREKAAALDAEKSGLATVYAEALRAGAQ